MHLSDEMLNAIGHFYPETVRWEHDTGVVRMHYLASSIWPMVCYNIYMYVKEEYL